MAKHECPECGASHEMNAEGRIAKLEERVKELEGRGCQHPHWYPYYQSTYLPTWTWPNTSGTAPNQGPITVYSTSSSAGELT